MKQIDKLKKTIPFKWRVQSETKSKPVKLKMIAYVDARDVAEHLDNIIGAENWCDKYYEVKGNLYCSLGIRVDGEWIFKSDVGTPSKTEKDKGESSDAFKRAAVKWGINRDAYRVGMIELIGKEYNGKYYPSDNQGKFLKGQALYDYCNSLAKIDELENYDIDIEDEYTELSNLYFEKSDLLKEDDNIEIGRILKERAENSYSKAIKILKAI